MSSQQHTQSYEFSEYTNSTDFRHDLSYENKIIIGNYSRQNQCLIDDEFQTVKRQFITQKIHVPKESIASISGHQQNEVLLYMKHSKTSEEVSDKPEGVLDDFWSSFVDCWTALFKLPHMVSKYSGRNDYQWKNGVFSKLYPFIIKDLDDQFEEDRQVHVSINTSSLLQDHSNTAATTSSTADQQQQQTTITIPNMITIGIQKTREIRQCLSKLKIMQKNPTIDQKLSLGETFVPFFCCKEMGDKGSQFQAENELSIAMKSCLDCQYKCLGSQSKTKRRIVVGLTCVGPIVTGFIMRRKQLSSKEFENDDATVSCMQPIDSFNLSLFDDLMRLAKFLASTKCYGDELVQDVRLRLRQLVSPKDTKSSAIVIPSAPKQIAATSPTDERKVQQQQPSKRKSPDVNQRSSSKKQKPSSNKSVSNHVSNNGETDFSAGTDSDLDADYDDRGEQEHTQSDDSKN